jgi:hypothetical protein
MKDIRYKYTILKNTDGKYWLWFDEKGNIVDGKYVPNLQPYHEIVTSNALREGAEIWSNEIVSVPESCQIRPIGQYSSAHQVKAKIKNESAYLATPPDPGVQTPIAGKKPGRG